MKFKYYYTTSTMISTMQQELSEAKHSQVPARRIFQHSVAKLPRYVGIGLLVFLLFIFIQVQVAKQHNQIPTVLGWQLYEVKTGSMEPTIPQGSLILAKALNDQTKINIQDIVTFEKDGKRITHRIIKTRSVHGKTYYRTKGDHVNNSIDEGEITRDNIKAIYRTSLPFKFGEQSDE